MCDSDKFAKFYRQLDDRRRNSGKDFAQFDDYEQETIALYDFNSDYGANGLADYFAWNGFSSLDITLRGLNRIGAHRLEVIVREYADLLREHGFDVAEHDVYWFIEKLAPALQAQFDSLQAEAAELDGDFYRCWESHYLNREG